MKGLQRLNPASSGSSHREVRDPLLPGIVLILIRRWDLWSHGVRLMMSGEGDSCTCCSAVPAPIESAHSFLKWLKVSPQARWMRRVKLSSSSLPIFWSGFSAVCRFWFVLRQSLLVLLLVLFLGNPVYLIESNVELDSLNLVRLVWSTTFDPGLIVWFVLSIVLLTIPGRSYEICYMILCFGSRRV